jgi:drug/metabolite transporter (DMT)-like permease
MIGRLLAGIAVFFWGASYVWGKITMQWLSPLQTSTARFGFSAILLLLIIFFMRKPERKHFQGHWWHYFLLGFIGIACFQALLFWAIDLTSAINAAVIMALSPAFTAIAEAGVTKRVPHTRMIVAIVISVIGATLAVLGAHPASTSTSGSIWGNLIAFISALCFTFYTVASRRWMPGKIPSLINITIVVTIGAVFLLALTLCLDSLPKTPVSIVPVWTLIGLVIGSTVIAYICWTMAIEKIGVSEPNLIFNFVPLVAMAISSVHGQPPNALQIIGAVLIIGGVTWGMQRQEASTNKGKI